jgi:hypothetical protein
MRKRLVVAGAAVIAVSAAGVGIAQAVGEGDERVTGPAADRAGRAAVDIVGGGSVKSVEREDDDGAAYEVEVVRADGKTVEVELNSALRPVGKDVEDEGDGDAD